MKQTLSFTVSWEPYTPEKTKDAFADLVRGLVKEAIRQSRDTPPFDQFRSLKESSDCRSRQE